MVRHVPPRVIVCGRDVGPFQKALLETHDVTVVPVADPSSLEPGQAEQAEVLVWVTSSNAADVGSALGCPCPVVVVTPDATPSATLAWLREGATEVCGLPAGDADLSTRLGAAVDRARARWEGHARDGSRIAYMLVGAAERARIQILVTDADGTIEYVNPQWCAQTGYTAGEAIGRTPRILKSGKMAADDYERLWARISSGRVWHGQLVNRRADGSEYAEQMVIAPVAIDGVIRFYLQVGVDITATVGVADTLQRAKRFETFGWAIGGMAHEFNNIFGVVLANAEQLASSADVPGSLAPQAIADILGEVEKGRAVVRKLLMYTGRWRIRPEPTDLGDLVLRLVESLRGQLPDGYSLDVHVTEVGPLTAQVDRDGLSEVLSHVVQNAQDSMPAGGAIEVRVGRRRLDDAFCAERPWARPGDFLSVSVQDHGVGMSESVQERLFDLLSGHRMDGGISGLGLPMTYGFVKQHGGYVLVESTTGRGTILDLLFPPSDNLGQATPRGEGGKADASTATTPRTVLYVEDNARLRRAARRILEAAGFRVEEAEDGRAALELLKGGAADTIDLVISDLMMPDIGGAALHRLVQELDPAPPFLFTTGHADASGPADERLPPDVPYLLKPWTGEQLIAAIEATLSGRG